MILSLQLNGFEWVNSVISVSLLNSVKEGSNLLTPIHPLFIMGVISKSVLYKLVPTEIFRLKLFNTCSDQRYRKSYPLIAGIIYTGSDATRCNNPSSQDTFAVVNFLAATFFFSHPRN